MTKRRSSIPPGPEITILMGVFNGARHLGAQLDSIAGQTHGNWRMICSDDGSTDDSLGIIHEFAAAHPDRIEVRTGPGAGFAQNYLSMIRSLPVRYGYVAFADQDDVWLPRKLARALDALRASGAGPKLYCGRRIDWNARTNRMTPSRQLHRPFGLQNAIIENVAFGNTIVLNPAATMLAREAAQRTGGIFAHDWWLYQLICAMGGSVRFDNGPAQILYRQHDANAIGAGAGLRSQFHRKCGVLRGLFSARVQSNLDALVAIDDLLTPEAREIVALFAAARRAKGLSRLIALHGVRPYRQHWSSSLGFWGAASLGRV